MNSIEIPITEIELELLAKASDSYRVNKTYGPYILYDRLVLAIKNAVLTNAEKEQIRKERHAQDEMLNQEEYNLEQETKGKQYIDMEQ